MKKHITLRLIPFLAALVAWSGLTVTASAQDEVIATFFTQTATGVGFGAPGALDTEIYRSSPASWRINITADDWAFHGFNAQDGTIPADTLASYAGIGWFEFYYRSDTAGNMRFAVRDPSAGPEYYGPNTMEIVFPVVETDEWTRVQIPFSGWHNEPPAGTSSWQFTIRGWGGMAEATVHIDDLAFVVPSGSIAVTGVSVTPETVGLAPGATRQLEATIAPAAASNQNVSWESSDTSVATVSESGLVTAISVGTSTITVTTEDGDFTDTVTVTVADVQTVFEDVIGGTPTGNADEFSSDWFGIFRSAEDFGGWIWHEGLGWLYAGYVQTEDAMWFWAAEFDAWVYTDAGYFPYVWVNNGGWIYYAMGGDGDPYMYDFHHAVWLPIGPLDRPAPDTAHPYLFFSSKDIPALRARMDDPAFAPRRARLIGRADALLNMAPNPGNSRYSQGNSGILGFAYVVTGNVEYAERAIEEALASAAQPSWSSNDFFNRGADLQSSERALGAAMVYDWCYDVMTEEQRATLREAMLEKGLRPYLSTIDPDLPENWYTYHPVNNWRGVSHGGNAVAALALYDESEEARQAAEGAYYHVPLALSAPILEDSGGHEGMGYTNYGVEYSLIGATALQRFYGGLEDVLREMADDRLGAYWDVYLHASDLAVINFGRHPSWNTGLWGQNGAVEGGPSSLRSALFDTLVPGGDELLRWAGDNGGQRFYWEAGSPFYFLWRRDAPSLHGEDKPALQDAVLFRGAGHAILQSPELYVGFNGGAAHNRGDVGAIVLIANGERLIHLEPSLNFLGSGYQSTYLINGAGQSTGGPPPRGEYLRFGSADGFHYLAADISPMYPDAPLSSAVRQLVMVRGKYLVLLDEIETTAAANIEARFQSAHDVTFDTSGGTVLGNQHDLHVQTAGFDAFTFGQGAGGALKYLSLSRNDTHATLLTVLYPTAKGGAAPTVVVEDGVVTITHGTEVDELVFADENDAWWLVEVNGESADGLTDFTERTIVPYRDGRDDSGEVPSWLLETVR